jgi:hypothetical protein
MNFYDKHAGGTWYLTWEEILHVLGHFEKKKGMFGYSGACHAVYSGFNNVQELCEQSDYLLKRGQ